jgi:signal transduction histidine kinase
MSASQPSVSLYQLVTQADPSLTSLTLSPKTFRGVLQGVLDFLNHRQVQANIWIKLPRRSSWQQILDRSIIRQSGLSHTLYRLERSQYYLPHSASASQTHPKPSPSPIKQPVATPPAPDQFFENEADLLQDYDEMIGDDGMTSTTDGEIRELIVPLIEPKHLRQEYFVLVVSEEISGLFLAHRPRSVHNSERRSLLLTLYSFDAAILEQAMSGLRQVVETGQQQYPEIRELSTLLDSWSHQLDICTHSSPSSDVLTHLMMQQINQQEGLVQHVERYRQQAKEGEKAKAEVQNLSRTIELKDAFLNHIEHELKQPLTHMKTALSLLDSSSLTESQRQRYTDMLRQVCQQQNLVIQGISELVQVEQAELQENHPSNLQDVVPGVVSTYQPLAQERDILLAYTVPDDLPITPCPPSWLRHILVNLLNNSMRFTSTNGRIWVTASSQQDGVQIEIQDTGSGISNTDLPRIFEPFYRGKSSSADKDEGAGLGLTIVQQLLTRCGGSISVQSQLHRGTTVKIQLPTEPT